MIDSMHKASFVPQDMGVIARKMCICADPLAISILIYVLSFQRPPRTVGNGVGQGGQVIHGLHRLTPVCLRLTYIPVSKVQCPKSSWMEGGMALYTWWAIFAGPPPGQCGNVSVLKKWKLQMERLWKVKTQQVWVPQEWRL